MEIFLYLHGGLGPFGFGAVFYSGVCYLRPYPLDWERNGPMWRDEEARLVVVTDAQVLSVRHMAPRPTLELVTSFEGFKIAALGPQQDRRKDGGTWCAQQAGW